MAIISITEGQTNTVRPPDTLLLPGINSCLALVTVLPQGTRLGGHAVLFNEGLQLSLLQICNYLNTRNYADMLYIIGDIGSWDQNWAGLPQTQNLQINGQAVHNVAGIATALGYGAKNVIFDISQWGVATYDIRFGFQNSARSLWGVRTNDGAQVAIPAHPSW